MVDMPRASTSSDLAPSASRSHDDPEDLDDPEANPLEDIESEAARLRTTTTTTGTRRRNRQERQEESELTRLTGAIADTRNMLERFVQTQRTMFRANNDMRENFINYTSNILRNVNNDNFAWMRYYIEEDVRYINRQPSQQAPQPPQQHQFSQATDGTLEEPRPGPSSQQPQDPFFAPPNRTVSPAYSISEFMNLSVSSGNLSGNLSQFQYTPLQTPLQTPSRTSPTPPMLERVLAPELAAQQLAAHQLAAHQLAAQQHAAEQQHEQQHESETAHQNEDHERKYAHQNEDPERK